MKIASIVGLAALFATACTAVPDVEANQRVQTDLQAAGYNSLASTFFERPTFVSVVRTTEGEILNVQRSDYTAGSSNVSFTQAGAVSARQMIGKFADWEEMATRDGDAFSKEIGRVGAFMGMETRLTFHSGDAGSHYLVANACSGAMEICAEDSAIYFDAENVQILDGLLGQFAAGEIEVTDHDAKYR